MKKLHSIIGLILAVSMLVSLLPSYTVTAANLYGEILDAQSVIMTETGEALLNDYVMASPLDIPPLESLKFEVEIPAEIAG